MWINELQNSIKQHVFTVYRMYFILHIHRIVHLHQNKQLENIAVTQTLGQ